VFAEEIITQKNEPSPFVEDSWTVVVLPDTQNYVCREKRRKRKKMAPTKDRDKILDGMMDWIVAERDRRNIKMDRQRR